MKYLTKVKLNTIRHYIKLKKRAFSKNCEIGKPFILSNAEFISLGKNVKICDGFRIECVKLGLNRGDVPGIVLGNNVICGYNISLLSVEKITIEEDVLIASNVMITTHNHGINPEDSRPYYQQELADFSPVRIERGCWIGEKAMILGGVNVGERSVISAGAVVTRDVPSFSIVAGVPAKVIKKYDFEQHKWVKI